MTRSAYILTALSLSALAAASCSKKHQADVSTSDIINHHAEAYADSLLRCTDDHTRIDMLLRVNSGAYIIEQFGSHADAEIFRRKVEQRVRQVDPKAANELFGK